MRSMKRVTKKLKQSLSILLAVAMVITCMPQTATAVMAAENEVVDTEGVDVNDVETTDVVDDAEVADDVEAVADTEDVDVATDSEDVEEPSSVEETTEEGGDNAEVVASEEKSEEIDTTNSDEVVKDAEVNLDEATTTHTFDFKAIGVTAADDNKEYAAGYKFGTDEYFSTVGVVTQKLNSAKDASIGVEVKAKEQSAIVFTTTAKANVTLNVGSTSGSNTSHIALKPVNADGTYGAAVNNGKENDLVEGTKGVDLTYQGLDAGTYAIVSPTCEDPDPAQEGKKLHDRGARIYVVTVTESVEGGSEPVTPPENPTTPTEKTTHTFDFKAIGVTAADDNKEYAAGYKFGTDEYFSTVGVVTQKLNSAKDASIGVEVKAKEQSAIVFTTTAKANVTLNVGSTSGSNTSHIALKPVNADGTYGAAVNNGKENDLVEGTKGVDLTYQGLDAGTYAIVSPTCEDPDPAQEGKKLHDRGARIYVVTVTEGAEGGDEPVTPPDEPTTPDDPKPGTSKVLDISKYEYGADVIQKDDGGTNYSAVELTKESYLLDSVFSVIATESASVTVIDSAKKITGNSDSDFTKRLNLNGKGTTSNRAVKFEVTEPSTLTLYILSNSPSGEARNLMLSDGTNAEALVATAPTEAEISADSIKQTKELAAGTYYLYCENKGINIYYLSLTTAGETPNPGPENPDPVSGELKVELATAEVVYNAQPQAPEVAKITLGEAEVAKENCTITYSTEDFTNVGTVTVTVTGNAVEGADYAGKTGTATYTIKPYDLKDATVTTDKKKPSEVTVKANDITLTETTDYTLVREYKDAAGAVVANPDLATFEGTVTITVTGVGNYTGTNAVTAECKPSSTTPDKEDESDSTQYRVWFVVENDDDTYYGDFEAGASISEQDVYDAIGYSKEYYVIGGVFKDRAFTPKSKWNYATSVVQEAMTLYVQLTQISVESDFYIPSIPDQEYTGAPIKPAVVVYAVADDGTRTLLKSGKDYKVTYQNNTDANINRGPDGSATETQPSVTITGNGNYSNTVVVPFNIKAASIGSDDAFAKGFTAKVTESLVENKGKALVPFASIKYKKAMKIDVDFAVTVKDESGNEITTKNNKGLPTVSATGNYELVVQGKGNFCGEVTKQISVADKTLSLSKATVKLGKRIKSLNFADIQDNDGMISIDGVDIASATASDTTFTVSVGAKTNILVPTDDYTYEVVYSNGTHTPALGKAQLIITAVNNEKCYGKKVVTFTVKGQDMKKANVSVNTTSDFKGNVKYNGKAHTQNNAVVVTVGEKTLVQKTDYTITYKNNIKKGNAVMTIKPTPESGYTGSATVKFKIDPVDISTEDVTPYGITKDGGTYTLDMNNPDGLPFTKAGVQPTSFSLVNSDSNVGLVKGTDYTVSYKNNKRVGDAQIIIKGKGNYSGSVTVGFKIRQLSLTEMNSEGLLAITSNSVVHKTGKSAADLKPAVKVLDGKKALAAKGKEYSVDYVGTAEEVQAFVDGTEGATRPVAVLKGAGAYADSDAEASIEVGLNIYKKENKFNKNNVTVDADDATYANGKQVTTKVSVKFGNDDLVEGTDYKLTWGKNNVAGNNKGNVKVEGQGRYGGSVTAKFNILKRDLNNKGDNPGPGPGPAPEEKTIKEGLYDFTDTATYTPETVAAIEGLTLDGIACEGNKHGLHTKVDNATMVLNLEKDATITVLSCIYGATKAGTENMTAGEYTVNKTEVDEEGSKAPQYTVSAKKGKLTLTFASDMYIHSLKVNYDGSVDPTEKTIKEGLYDFTDTATYTQETVAAIEGLTLDGIVCEGNKHGLHTKVDNATMVLNLENDATITVLSCIYGATDAGTENMTAGEYTVNKTEVDEEGKKAPQYTVSAKKGKLTLTFASNMYIHSLNVAYSTTEDKYTKEWYENYIDTTIADYKDIVLAKLLAKDDIKEILNDITYDSNYKEFTVTLNKDSADKKIMSTFNAFKDKYLELYRDDPRIQIYYDRLKDKYNNEFKEDIDHVDYVNVKVTAPSGKSKEKNNININDYINNYKDKSTEELIRIALNKYEELLLEYADKLENHKASERTIGELENIIITSTANMYYDNGKDPIEFEYSVRFKLK